MGTALQLVRTFRFLGSQTPRIKICILARSPGGSCAHLSLNTFVLEEPFPSSLQKASDSRALNLDSFFFWEGLAKIFSHPQPYDRCSNICGMNKQMYTKPRKRKYVPEEGNIMWRTKPGLGDDVVSRGGGSCQGVWEEGARSQGWAGKTRKGA